jgi:O-glycosyl hydrolase
MRAPLWIAGLASLILAPILSSTFPQAQTAFLYGQIFAQASNPRTRVTRIDRPVAIFPPTSDRIAPPSVPDVVVSVDASLTYQALEGFGSSHVALAWGPKKDDLSPKLRTKAIDAIYGQVRLNTGNIASGPIEASANAKDPWGEQANDDDDPFHFNWEAFNFSALDAVKEKVIDLARPKGFDDFYPGLLVSVRWANPWMKVIRAKDYDRFLDEAAEQIAAGMIHWRDAFGIVPKYVQIFNEPTSGNHELDPGSIPEVIDVVKRVGDRLGKEGFSKVKFVVPGEETEEKSLQVAAAILADPDARKYVGAIAYHTYPYGSTYCDIPRILNTSGRGSPDPDRVAVRRQLRDLAAKYGLPLWMTEISHGAVSPLSFDDLLGRAIHIHDELVYANAAAYFGMLNMVDAHTTRGRDPFTEEGSIAIIDTTWEKVYITGIGFAIGQYARWIPRGYLRVDATSSDPLLLVTAFRDEARKRLVLVFINNETQPTTVNVQLKDFALELPLKFTGEQSTAQGAWAPVVPIEFADSSQIRFSLSPRSVTTVATAN